MVFSFTAQVLAVSRGQDQYILSLSECFFINLCDHYIPTPFSGNSGPKCVLQISLTCSWSLQWLSRNSLFKTSTAYSIMGFTSEGKIHPFSALLSALDFPPFTHHRSVESASLILLPVLMKWLLEIWVHATFALRGFVPSVLAFLSK